VRYLTRMIGESGQSGLSAVGQAALDVEAATGVPTRDFAHAIHGRQIKNVERLRQPIGRLGFETQGFMARRLERHVTVKMIRGISETSCLPRKGKNDISFNRDHPLRFFRQHA